MPTKTKTEYETVEKTIEYTECDVPGCCHTDEESELIELAVNPRYQYEENKEPIIIEVFDEYEEAVKRKDKEINERRIEKTLPPGFGNSGKQAINKHAFGYDVITQTEKAKNDTSFYVCLNCLKHHFEAVPEDYSPERVNDTEADNGRILITEEYNPLFSIPDWVYLISACVYVVSFVLWIVSHAS